MNAFFDGFKNGISGGILHSLFGGWGCGFGGYGPMSGCYSPMNFYGGINSCWNFGMSGCGYPYPHSALSHGAIPNYRHAMHFMPTMYSTPMMCPMDMSIFSFNNYIPQQYDFYLPPISDYTYKPIFDVGDFATKHYNDKREVTSKNKPTVVQPETKDTGGTTLEVVSKPTTKTERVTIPFGDIYRSKKTKQTLMSDNSGQIKIHTVTPSMNKSCLQFLTDLGARESRGNYKIVNSSGYAGKYQMGEMALVDAGYYEKPSKKYNNDWSGRFTGKDGVYSLQDFLNSPRAQENAQIIFKKKQWGYLKNVGADKYIGKEINGYTITQSGLLAGAHLKGAGSVIDYLKSNGKINGKDGNGTSVESYMRQFAGYDVSDIIV